jgi:hypothetical protein
VNIEPNKSDLIPAGAPAFNYSRTIAGTEPYCKPSILFLTDSPFPLTLPRVGVKQSTKGHAAMPSKTRKTRSQLTKTDREKAKKGIRARADAVKVLIERHKTEFDELIIKNRLAAGLAPTNSGPSREQLAEKIRKAEDKLARDRELLRVLS